MINKVKVLYITLMQHYFYMRSPVASVCEQEVFISTKLKKQR